MKRWNWAVLQKVTSPCRRPSPLWGGAPRPWTAASWHRPVTQNWQSQSHVGSGETTFLGTRIPHRLCPLFLRQPRAVASASMVWVPAPGAPLTPLSPHTACSFILLQILCFSSRWLLAFRVHISVMTPVNDWPRPLPINLHKTGLV